MFRKLADHYRCLTAGLGCAALLATAAAGQVRQEPRVYSAFIKDGPVVTGKIAAIQALAGNAETGTLTVDITGELRGHLSKTQIELPWTTHVNPKYPPFVWARVPPVVGHRVLLFLTDQQGLTYADEVLDLDRGDDKWLPKIQAMLSLEKQATAGDTKALLDDLSSSDQDMRSLAANLLLVRNCAPAGACRTEGLSKLNAIARDRTRRTADRVWAASMIAHQVYVGVPASSASDEAAASALAALLADPDAAVRNEAVQDLHGLLLGGGVTKPRIDISETDRARVVEQLRRDAQAGGPFAADARDLSEKLATP